jgi:hypothetical protein
MVFTDPIHDIGFIPWLRSNRENRWLLSLVSIGIFIQFIIFKYLYPFPNFMPPDSYSYLRAAYENEMINMWAIGYSKFLHFFSTFETSDVVLVWFQYLFLEAAILYFLFTIRYLLSPGKWVFRVLLVVSVFNPLIPHISNFVSSDCLFTTVALMWFTQLCWIFYRPTLRLFLAHAVVGLFCFMVRYNALYFPIISIILIFFSTTPRRQRWIGIGAIILLVGGFFGRTELAYSQRTGTHQFSAFGGWEMAANALYGYAHSKLDPPEAVPAKFRQLHMTTNRHMDSISRLADTLRPDREVLYYYLWDSKSPLKVYMDSVWKGKDTTAPYFVHWAKMAPLYSAYGRYLILHHPGPFLRYYIWPNAIKYYVPPMGFMDSYILGNTRVDIIAATWFHWKSNAVHTRTKSSRIWVTTLFSIPLAICNVGFLTCFMGFVLLGAFKTSTRITRQVLRFMLVIWVSNMVFSVFAAPIELRYQLFAMITTVVFFGLLLSYMIGRAMVD